MTSCPLLNLPRELRDHIYSHLFRRENKIDLFVLGHSTRYALANFQLQDHIGNDRETFTSALSSRTAVLQTCKQIRHEATPIFEDSILWNVNIEGQSPGLSGFGIEETEMHKLVGKMRRVCLTLKMTYVSFGSVVSSSPRLSDVEQVLSPLKRNSAVFLRMLKDDNEHVKIETINLDFEARLLEECGVVDSAVVVLERLGRHPGVKIYDKSRPRSAITEECMNSLVDSLGGKDCTEKPVDTQGPPCAAPLGSIGFGELIKLLGQG